MIFNISWMQNGSFLHTNQIGQRTLSGFIPEKKMAKEDQSRGLYNKNDVNRQW